MPSNLLFTISSIEINRRRLAFTTFIASLFLGILLTTLALASRFIFTYPLVFFISLFGSLGLFLFFRFLIFKHFDHYLKTTYTLTPTYLDRRLERYWFKDLATITTLYTSRSEVRNIMLTFTHHRSLTLDGLSHFKDFHKRLLALNPTVPHHEAHEPLDYDHPLFYVFLGLILGFLTVIFLIFITSATFNLQWLFLGIALYVFGNGLYFLIQKPQVLRYGPHLLTADLLCGLILILSALVISYYAFSL